MIDYKYLDMKQSGENKMSQHICLIKRSPDPVKGDWEKLIISAEEAEDESDVATHLIVWQLVRYAPRE